MPKNLMGSSQAPLDPNNKFQQVIYSWMPEKSNSLLSKVWGYQVQTRITLLPDEIQIQEVASSRFERAWQGFYTTLSTLWGGKPEFTVSVFANEAIPTHLNAHQAEKLKSLLEQENLAADSINTLAMTSIFGRVKSLLESVVNEDSFSSIKLGLPETLEMGNPSWEISKAAIKDLARNYFKGNPDAFLYPHADAILDRIASVLSNENFLKNPKAFMVNWDKARGMTEEYRIPEDPSRYFLNKIFL